MSVQHFWWVMILALEVGLETIAASFAGHSHSYPRNRRDRHGDSNLVEAIVAERTQTLTPSWRSLRPNYHNTESRFHDADKIYHDMHDTETTTSCHFWEDGGQLIYIKWEFWGFSLANPSHWCTLCTSNQHHHIAAISSHWTYWIIVPVMNKMLMCIDIASHHHFVDCSACKYKWNAPGNHELSLNCQDEILLHS